MKIIIFIIILLIVILSTKNKENFTDLALLNSYESANFSLGNSYTGDGYSTEIQTPIKNDDVKCCLIENKYVQAGDNDADKLFGGIYKYKYTKMQGNQCKPKYHDSNKQIFIDGQNNWSNNNCDENNKITGSCRLANKECIDFVDKVYCDKYKMTWRKETCHQPFTFKWVDRVTRLVPEIPKAKQAMFKDT